MENTTYFIYEVNTGDANNKEKPDHVYTGTLSNAKRYASRNQFFQRTDLHITYENGGQVSFKEWKGKWVAA